MADLVPCPGCGAQVTPTGVCRFCGSTAFVDGIAGKLLPSDLKCPRCPGKPPLRGVEHEGFRADLCMKCHGVWFGLGMLEEVIRSAVKRKAGKGEGEEGPVHGGVEPVRYARCPKCDGGMARVPFAQKPLVIIDQCPSHGNWCDGGELAQLKAVARTRGVEFAVGPKAAAKTAPKEEGAKPVVRLTGGRLSQDASEVEALGHFFAPRQHRRRRGQRDLFDVLWDLMDL